MKIQPKEKILIAAANLFYVNGISKVSVNQVADKSGMSKMTLYKYFQSKEVLIQEVMRFRSEEWILWFETLAKQATGSPENRIIHIFDIMAEWFNQPSFEKCPFSTIASEIGTSNPLAYKACMEPAYVTRNYVLALAKEAGLYPADEFADQAVLLLSGAILIANLNGQLAGLRALDSGRKTMKVVLNEYQSREKNVLLKRKE